MKYILGIFIGNITFIPAAKILVQSSENTTSVFTAEWIGLIFLSIIGFLFIYRSSEQIKKVKKLQEELTTYQTTVSSELDMIGEKDA